MVIMGVRGKLGRGNRLKVIKASVGLDLVLWSDDGSLGSLCSLFALRE